ncbi:MAG: autotransporter outer membrane beta-barrel domain-containing protein, partial [Litorimonas sp.]
NQGGALKGVLGNRSGKGSVDVWAEAQFSNFELGQGDGDFQVVYVGADYVASDRLLVGAMAQYVAFDYNKGGAGDVDGEGFLVGPYATVKLGDQAWFDGRVAWGSSDNEVNALGTFSDAFDTSRALYSASVSGDFDVSKGTAKGATTLTPQLSVRYLDETQKAYTDGLGVRIPEQSIGLGEVSLAPRLSHTVTRTSGWTVSPYAQAEGILSFGDAADEVFGSDTRLRFEGGSGFMSPNGARFGVSAFADGLGESGYENYGLRFSVSYTMK